MTYTFYHGTSQKAYRNILKHGFKVGSEATIYNIPHRYVFLSRRKSHAKKYALSASKRHNSYPVVLEVHVKKYIPESDNALPEDRGEVAVKPDWILSYKKVWEDKTYQSRKHRKVTYSWKYEKLFYNFDDARRVFDVLSKNWMTPSIRGIVDTQSGKQFAWIVRTEKPIKECLRKVGLDYV